MQYQPRVVDADLGRSLEAIGAVVIEGPRACGKTETARQAANSEVRLDHPTARRTFSIDPDLLLAGETPRLIDEWQVEPDIWNHVRHAVDDRQAVGQFILTGSAVPRDDAARHPGAGRFIHLRMRPMTLGETGHSTGAISLATVLTGQPVSSPEPGLTVPDLAERVVVGGWPRHLGLTATQALRAMRGYIDDICRADVQRLDGARRDPQGVLRLITALARNVGCPATIGSLTADANGRDGAMKPDTVRGYLDALGRLMFTDDVPAWKPGLRSRTRLRAAPVRHLADPALATGAMNASPEHLLRDLGWFGFLFESLVVRDLRVYAEALGLRSSTIAMRPASKPMRSSSWPTEGGQPSRSSSGPALPWWTRLRHSCCASGIVSRAMHRSHSVSSPAPDTASHAPMACSRYRSGRWQPDATAEHDGDD